MNDYINLYVFHAFWVLQEEGEREYMVCDLSSYPIVVCLFNVLDIILYHFVSSGECLIHLIVRRKRVKSEKTEESKTKQNSPTPWVFRRFTA